MRTRRQTISEVIHAYLAAKKFQRGGTEQHDPVCSTFGCGKHLILTEHLAGSHCTECMNIKPININLIIKNK